MAKGLIALDADGVLLDFHLGYADAWRRAFGARRRSATGSPTGRWTAGRSIGSTTSPGPLPQALRRDFWTSVPAIEGAIEACHRLHDAGFDLVCVSALEAEFESARLRNLRDLGFPIERVIATGNNAVERSPKADAITELNPEAFVDDYLPYMRGVPAARSHRAGAARSQRQPNVGEEMKRLARSIHPDLPDFASHWLAR
jgi:phosphoglycolate phosphatase-like HAD superfamily hydrolase